ncbi:MAG: hypothetical protein K8R02_03020 [Anaerohalosphaeraceae bacterium]|nr:hypothetical protein [Anaerohalosphaeraceae bacterium]
MTEDSIIKTRLFRSDSDFIHRRSIRIAEAIAFKSGTIADPVKTVISTISQKKESYFLKPGKETQRATPNIHDMFPNVGSNNKSETDGFTFEVIWEYLIKISIINQLTFKKVLVLLYRLCFLLDHNLRGEIRYHPSPEILDYISKMDFALKDGFKDKFKKNEIELLEFLHFIDLLGWNEDVKYHIKNGQPDFEDRTKRNVGRTNTIISVISVPLMINDFLANIIENVNYIERINVRLILSTMQKLSKSRGICVLSGVALQRYLEPYLEK